MPFFKDNCLISLKDSYATILSEAQLQDLSVDDTRDQNHTKNYFQTDPKGIIIQDSFNNFAFPIQPEPQIDDSRSNFSKVFKRFHELYIQSQHDLLPWHFMIEMVGSKYVVYNTRPIMMRYPLRHQEVLERKSRLPFGVTWNSETEDFMRKNQLKINEMIHVCILGDSSVDVYPKKFYKALGQFCIRPFIHYFKLPQTSYTRTFPLNVGSKFNFEYLFKVLYK